MLKQTLLAALAAIPLCSCFATAGDIADIKATIQSRDDAYEDDIKNLRDGAITEEEFQRRQLEAKAQMAAEFDAKMAEIQGRGHAFLEGLPSTGSTWLDLAIGAVALIGGATKTTNVLRDRERRVRGEPVGKMSSPVPATPPLPTATPPALNSDLNSMGVTQ